MPIEKPIKPVISATRVSDTEIQITKTLPTPEPTVQNYDRGFIDSQILAVLAQKQSYDDARDAELAELYGIRDEMDKAGIVAVKPKEEVVDGTIG